MKSKSLLLTGLFTLVASAVLHAQEVKFNMPTQEAAPAATTPAALAPQISETTIMETFGWFVTARLGIAELKFTPEQIQAFARGAALAAGGEVTPHDLATVGPVMDKFISERQSAAMERARQANLVEGEKFFSVLKNRPGLVSTESGLIYEIQKAGEGPNVTASDTVMVTYKGMLLSGQVFDSSEIQGSPLVLVMEQALPGWREGLQHINKGGKIKLYIPADLAYGDEAAGGIPPGSSLIFEIEILEINPVVPPEAIEK